MYKNSTKFEVSWPCLDGLCGSVIWAQSRHPESIHLTSKQFCNFTGCSHPSSRASPFGLDRYDWPFATWSVFSLKSIAYFDLFTVFSVEFATLDSSMWSKILGPYLFGLWIADFKLFGRNQCIYPLYSILISWDAFGLQLRSCRCVESGIHSSFCLLNCFLWNVWHTLINSQHFLPECGTVSTPTWSLN